MQSNLTIRKAKPSDLAEVVELWKELMDFHSNLDPFFTQSKDGSDNFLKWVEKQMELEDAELIIADVSSYPTLVRLQPAGQEHHRNRTAIGKPYVESSACRSASPKGSVVPQ